ncbi:hypothetical protein HPP92_028731 [Vanilla planifolia]|uniref:Uncharacterized protein n=1 Tax=Vanilla planifolia TaxID=51239 RepID=A0A835P7F5_VANPL|nr:hypothetical protein HPP92_028731 [Vanilla planifolia]
MKRAPSNQADHRLREIRVSIPSKRQPTNDTVVPESLNMFLLPAFGVDPASTPTLATSAERLSPAFHQCRRHHVSSDFRVAAEVREVMDVRCCPGMSEACRTSAARPTGRRGDACPPRPAKKRTLASKLRLLLPGIRTPRGGCDTCFPWSLTSHCTPCVRDRHRRVSQEEAVGGDDVSWPETVGAGAQRIREVAASAHHGETDTGGVPMENRMKFDAGG